MFLCQWCSIFSRVKDHKRYVFSLWPTSENIMLANVINEGEVVLVPPICKSQLSRLLLCTRHLFLSLCFGRKLCVCVAQKLRWFVCKMNSPKDASVMSRESWLAAVHSRVRVTSLLWHHCLILGIYRTYRVVLAAARPLIKWGGGWGNLTRTMLLQAV